MSCVFCDQRSLIIIAENGHAFAVRDKFPVKPLHTLVIPKRHIVDIFESDQNEREAIHELAMLCRAAIVSEDGAVAGFNFGSNVGHAAGQKIFHAHVHLIPRRLGDIAPPPAKPE
jgi:diadenosine tetraphosphate (Ap4A) HIT family hydrolase